MQGKSPFRRRGRCAVASLMIMLFVVSASGAAAAFKNLKVGDQALPLALKDLEGQERSLAAMGDAKAALVFFWASWSERSLKELEDLKKIQAAYGDKGLSILAVNVEGQEVTGDALGRVRSLVQEKELTFPVVLDEGLKTYNEWGVVATPTTAIVDKAGTVVFDLSSYPTSGYLEMEEAVQRALGLYEEKVVAAKKPTYQPTRDSMLHLGLGRRLMDKGFMTKAIPEFQLAAEADTHYADPHLYLGFAHFREGKVEEASASIEKARELDPEKAEARLLAAYILATQEKVDEALELLQNAAGPAAENQAAEAGTTAQAGGDQPLDLSQVESLRGEGKTAEAMDALESVLAEELGRLGFALERKKKVDAMERLRLMMQQKGAQ